ncbi:MAG TPA: 3-oxoacyl-[acyl-carrier-protein] synthase III C-terminal domain-containing protein [Gemmatimonadaceae bacterium]
MRELAERGQLESDAERLEEFGFSHVYVADCETPYSLALDAATTLMNEQQVPPASVDLLIYCGTPAVAFARGGDASDTSAHLASTRRFRYPATRLQYDLGLECASTIALDQLACTSLFAAVRLAQVHCAAGEARRVLCVSSEFFPSDAGREAIFNCTSDAACALLVDAEGERNRIVSSVQVTKGYYWDCDAMRNEIVASYFPTARHVIDEALRRAEWDADDISLVLPHNVSTRSWEILLGLIGIPRERLWDRNIARVGHTLAGDNFINLRDAIDDGGVNAGDRLLLFSYGYGAHWSALMLEA